MVIRDSERDRQYALEHYFLVGPDQLTLRERTTGLTVGDLLSTSVEMLLDDVDPGGPKPWLRAAADEQWRPVAADQGSTVTMTEVYGDEGWRPRWPGRRRSRG